MKRPGRLLLCCRAPTAGSQSGELPVTVTFSRSIERGSATWPLARFTANSTGPISSATRVNLSAVSRRRVYGGQRWAGSSLFGDSLAAQPAGGGRDVRVVVPLESLPGLPWVVLDGGGMEGCLSSELFLCLGSGSESTGRVLALHRYSQAGPKLRGAVARRSLGGRAGKWRDGILAPWMSCMLDGWQLDGWTDGSMDGGPYTHAPYMCLPHTS